MKPSNGMALYELDEKVFASLRRAAGEEQPVSLKFAEFEVSRAEAGSSSPGKYCVLFAQDTPRDPTRRQAIINLRQLRYFLAVVDQGGAHRAAEALRVSQPSISQALRSLEQELGTTLFDRTGRTLTLTAAGEALIPAAREVMQGIDLARASVDAVHGLRTGRLVVCSTPSQAASPLAPMIGQFLEKYPDVKVIVKAAAGRADVESSLRGGGAEIGLIARALTVAPPADLIIQPLEVQKYLCVARESQALPAGSAPLPPQALSGARLIVGQLGTGVRRAADLVLAGAPGSRIVVEIESREALLPLVLAGAGIAVVADGFRAVAEATGLSVRELDLPESLAVDLIHRPGTVSPAAQAFLDLAHDWSRTDDAKVDD